MQKNKAQSNSSSSKSKSGGGNGIGQLLSSKGTEILPAISSNPIKPIPIVPQAKLLNQSTDMNFRNENNDTLSIGAGSPWLAYLLTFLAVFYITFIVFIWVGQEEVFQEEYGKVPSMFISKMVSKIIPDIVYQKSTSRFIVAKILCLYFSFPLVFMIEYLSFMYLLTVLHWFGCFCNRSQYLLPKSRLSTIVFITELAPSLGILSSCWGLMSRDSTTEQYSKFVTLGPTFVGIICLILGLIYLNIVPKLKQIEVVN